MQDAPRFVHLRVRSEYSLLEGAVRLDGLPALCIDNGMPAVAVTDNGNLFCALEFATILSKAGIQPIHGCQFAVRAGQGGQPSEGGSIVLLAKDESGYGNLLKLNSCLYLDSDNGSAELTMDQLRLFSEGLICLTGGAEGPVGRLAAEGRHADAEAALLEIAEIYPGRAYVEIQRHLSDESDLSLRESAAEPVMLKLAYKNKLPLVATNDVHFPNREMFDAHDALICIAQAAHVEQIAGRRRLTPEHYFKSAKEMAELFADLPEAVSNSVEIARRCSFWAQPRDPILPVFTENEGDELRRQAREGLTERLAVITPAAAEEKYRERLEYELGVIESMGFAGYFLIVADFIKWAKKNGIPVGAGRGSGAGSLAAYALTITDLDPIRFDLIFERFLNPERISMPDFDVDFCQERRDEVIRYVRKKYGEDRVAHIITFGALLSRAAVRDVGRVLRIPYPKTDAIAKMIPRDGARNVPVEEALEREPRLRDMRDSDPLIGRLFEYARSLEGLLRNASTHAAGVVIGNRPLDELVPVYQDPRAEMPATQFSMKWAERAGLVKFDFLGLKTLTAIKKAVDLLAGNGVEIDINNLPLDDEKTFQMCAAAETVAVFQLESSGMKETLRRLKPACIEDIVALVALYRPGPMDNIPAYCDVKNGLKNRKQLHETIDWIVAETHGIMVYQEQVMQIAQSMAGYSLGQADLLRRAIGKKVKEDMDAEKPKFLEGAKRNGVAGKTAAGVWDLMARFAEYGFPKAHAAAYALVSYQTAWLKANHPVEFMASVMNCEIGETDKLKAFAGELQRLNIKLRPPCVNASDAEFATNGGEVLYGLGAVRNIGSEAARRIVDERKAGPFKDLFDFAGRIELRHVGKRQLECLAQSGAFDALDGNRKRVFESVDLLLSYSAVVFEERNSGQDSLFGGEDSEIPPPSLPDCGDWGGLEKSENELFAIGYYLTGHPLDAILSQLKKDGILPYAELVDLISSTPRKFLLAGYVSAVQQRISRQGNKYAFVELSDPSGNFEITVFSDLLHKHGEQLAVGSCLKAVVTASSENDQMRLKTEVLEFLDISGETDRTPAMKGLRIYFKGMDAPKRVRDFLETNCRKGEGQGEISFCPAASDISCDFEIKIPGKFMLNSKVKKAIASLEGIVVVNEY